MMNFLKDSRGNVAMIFALCLIPLVVLMGGAIDFSRQRSGEGLAQDAVDAALLAIAGTAQDKTDAQLTREALVWFENHMQDLNLDIDDFQVVKVGDELTATVNGHVDTAFLGLIGINDLDVVRTASVRIGLTAVELVMVLDTTGSMMATPSGQSMTKLESMQDAALDMVDMLSDLDNGRGNIEIGLVPFATYVNVGADNIDANWMDSSADSPVHGDNLVDGLNRFDLYEHMGFDWKGCVMARPAPHDVEDTRPRPSDPDTLFVPVFHPDETDSRYRWYQEYPNNYVPDSSTSLGSELLNISNPVKYGVPDSILAYVDGISNTVLGTLNVECADGTDVNLGIGQECNEGWAGSPFNPDNWEDVTINRDYDYYSDVDTQIGPGFSCEMPSILPLSANFQTVRNNINSLTASGSTNIAQGAVWGYHALSPSAPFTEGDRYSHSVQKVMIILSDGNNVVVARENHPGGSDFSAYGYMENRRLEGLPRNYDTSDIMDTMDERTLMVCDNAKEDGIRIFTIRVSLEDQRSEDLLQACASTPEDYIDVPDSDRLDEAFREITDRISQLYLTR
ncbi:pilus assembly protein [Ponticaulis sp.]|uniref:TadE/TadG family type IV pilus assembly protein n=1 Tax=Ponticaulis sp. TaxID=2020902 RepID=UPI002637D000|nr:pilus assembly protein [Ponticaulis sp.]MDF1680337.1 pilus assembly protein [Ponticaulis sp.]